MQSLADHIIQHCDPVPDFVPNWYSDLHSETPSVQRLIPIVAVPQLLDLAVPEPLANAAAEFEYRRASPAMVLASSRLLSRERTSDEDDEDRWGGYVLRSPRYARSVLARLGRLQEAFLVETFAALARHSIAQSRSDFGSWRETDAEFVRLIFQRLARWEYNRLSNVADGLGIAKTLFSEFGGPIARLLKDKRAVGGCARWAGTLSYLFPSEKQLTFRAGDSVVERIVYDLASFAVRQTSKIEGAPTVVPLLRAICQLAKKYEGEDRVSELWQAADYAIRLTPMIECELARVTDRRQRRANRAIIAYVNFLEAKPQRKGRNQRAAAAKVYDRVRSR